MYLFLSFVRYLVVGSIFFVPASLHAQDTAPVGDSSAPAVAQGSVAPEPSAVPPVAETPPAAAIVGPPAAPSMLDLAGNRPECRWTGQRIVSLLWRDDVSTALQHVQIYKTFGCPEEKLRDVFACLVGQGDFDPQGTPALAVRILSCWTNSGVTAATATP